MNENTANSLAVPQSPSLISSHIPPSYAEWRDSQPEALHSALSSDRRFTFLSMPTGLGKSLVYICAALSRPGRACVLTSHKPLQDQLRRDFEFLHDMRGQNAYRCEIEPTRSVDRAPCHAGVRCDLKEGGCKYFDDLRWFRGKAPYAVTNYHLWMSLNKYMEGAGHWDLLIMDEGHEALDNLLEFLAIEIPKGLIRKHFREEVNNHGHDISRWKAWASVIGSRLKRRISSIAGQGVAISPKRIDEIHDLKKIARCLDEINIMSGEWRAEDKGSVLRLDPVMPDYKTVDNVLFGSVPRVIITSATLSRADVKNLRIDDGQWDYYEYPSPFPVENRRVQPVRACKISYKTPEEDMVDYWIPKIDDIIQERRDRKGIVHTVSHKNSEIIRANTRHNGFIYWNQPGGIRVEKVIDAYRNAKPPAVLVSPSVSQGYDFPMDDCEYQIIAKLPFPSLSSPVTRARADTDEDYIHYLTMKKLVQMVGRGVRSVDDVCETFIVDDNFEWWWKRYKRMAPSWFSEAVQKYRMMPQKPVKKYQKED